MGIEEFIDTSNKSTSVDELFKLYSQSMAAIGFDRVIFSLMTEHIAIERESGHGVIANYPAEWMSYYNENRFEVIDPVRRAIYSSNNIFTWDDLLEGDNLTKNQRNLMHMGEDAGLHNGIGVPFRGSRGAIAGVGAASSVKSLKGKDRNSLSMANLLSQQFYTVFMELEKARVKDRAAEDLAICLSDREQEILQWCSRGKTKWEIGQIISISEHTVNFHIKNVMKKLDANNISLAILRALNLGLIQL